MIEKMRKKTIEKTRKKIAEYLDERSNGRELRYTLHPDVLAGDIINILASLGVMVPVEEPCEQCEREKRKRISKCRACNGTGKVTRLVSLKEMLEGK